MSLMRYILILTNLTVGVAFLLTLISYDAYDSGVNVISDVESISNFGGKIGAIVSDVLMQQFGLSCFIIPFVFINNAILSLFGKEYNIIVKFTVCSLFILSCSTFFSLVIKNNHLLQMPVGGYLGYFITNKFITLYDIELLSTILSLFLSITFLYNITDVGYYRKFLSGNVQKSNDKPITIKNSKLTLKGKINIIKMALIPQLKSSVIALLKLLINPFLLTYDFLKSFSAYLSYKIKELNNNGNIEKESDTVILKTKTKDDSKKVKKENTSNSEMYIKPSYDFLTLPSKSDVVKSINDKIFVETADKIVKIFSEFGVVLKINGYFCGPVVTLYELQPKPGTKSSRIIGLADDIARSMCVESVRIANMKNKDALGIEVPNINRSTVYLREIIDSEIYQKDSEFAIPLILGKTISGKDVVVDLAKMPHLLIAGTTGSGKSIGINCMILSILYKLSPDICKLIMIDPKMLEFSSYDSIPHLLTPVVTDPKKAITALQWATKEMERRYRVMSDVGVRNINNYNEKISQMQYDGKSITKTVHIGYDDDGMEIKEDIAIEAEKMPFIVIFIDEMADLMMVAGKEIEFLVQRLSQMARAAGIHIITATQRPSVDVITGVIKSNFPTRISYQVTSKIDSRTIIGEQGAEQLLGKGDMLYMSMGGKLTRIHGPFVSDEEVAKVTGFLRSNYKTEYADIYADFNENIEDELQDGVLKSSFNYSSIGTTPSKVAKEDKDDNLYQSAVDVVMTDKRTSISYIQRKLRIGYNTAARMVEKMEEDGILSAPDHLGKRVIMKK